MLVQAYFIKKKKKSLSIVDKTLSELNKKTTLHRFIVLLWYFAKPK